MHNSSPANELPDNQIPGNPGNQIPDNQMPDNQPPDSWLTENSHYLRPKSHVLDLACGSGRNTSFLLSLGFQVTCIDIDIRGMSELEKRTGCTVIQADLENDNPWPLNGTFDAIVVINYLYRPLFSHLIESLAEGGILIYKTFMEGNEKFGRPSNPDFLLKKNELIDAFGKELRVLSFDQGYEEPAAMTQRICVAR